MRNKNAKVVDPNSFVTCPGNEFESVYEAKVNPDGSIELIEVGKRNIQDEIQSFAEHTDIAYMIHQLQLGNTAVLNPRPPMFGDFLTFPKSYAEVLQLYIDGERAFDHLDAEVKVKFDNDFMKWFAQAGSDGWFEKMGFNRDLPIEPVSEVKEES